ncbi:MAG: hypothetical protein M1275_03060 [Patescibacteria group bacterium]|nr:hypothetical protein [Patescibacteria group bacterium]
MAKGNTGVELLILRFKNEFPIFLDELDLPKICFNSKEKQRRFGELLFEIIKDVPLILTGKKRIEFRVSNVEKHQVFGPIIGWQAKVINEEGSDS